jgi:hypothetical protein
MALAAQYMRGQVLPQSPSAYREQAAAPAYQPFQPQIPLPAQMQQRMPARTLARPTPGQAAPQASVQPQALPSNIYGAATTVPAAADRVQAGPALAGGPPPAQPQQLAAVAPQAARTVGGAPRFYSLHRGYGLEPDAIPEPPAGNRYVLIGPPDDGGGVESKSKSDDDDPDTRPGAF